MNKRTFLAGCALCLLFPVLVQGQEAGLLRLNPDRPSAEGSASVWGGYEIGGYRPTYGSSSQWTAGADAQGLRHGKKTTWLGAFSFGQTTGRDMYSSMFLEPGYYPLDILETPQGTKSRQDVRLEGAFLTDLGYEWALGLKASFQGAHYVKQPEFRHTTSGLKVRLEPTITYIMDDNSGFASAYIFQMRAESIRPEGGSGEGSEVFLDKGLRYGVYHDFAGAGAFSVRETAHGFSELFQSPEFTLGLTLLFKSGTMGDAGATRFRYPGSDWSFFFGGTVLADRCDHLYRASLGRKTDKLQQPDGDAFSVISMRSGWNLNLSYGLQWERQVLRKLLLDLDGSRWAESYLGPPAYDLTKRYVGMATLLADFAFGPVEVRLKATGGRGWWQDQGLQGVDADSAPARLDVDWLRKMEYIRAPRGGAGGTLTYRFSGVKGLYLQAEGFWMRAFRVTLLPGHNRVSASLRVGYDF